MITYSYRCHTCHHEFETKQSIKEKPLTECFCCKQHSLERVIEGGMHASVRQDATTVGQRAERNSKKMGKTKVQELDAKREKPAFYKSDKQAKIEKIIAGGKERVDRYIHTGK